MMAAWLIKRSSNARTRSRTLRLSGSLNDSSRTAGVPCALRKTGASPKLHVEARD